MHGVGFLGRCSYAVPSPPGRGLVSSPTESGAEPRPPKGSVAFQRRQWPFLEFYLSTKGTGRVEANPHGAVPKINWGLMTTNE